MQTTSFQEKSMRHWKWVAGAALLWWILGVNLFIYHAAAVLFFLYLWSVRSRQGRGVAVPASALFLWSIAFVYAFSIALNSPGGDANRILAAVYNLSFWLIGGMLVLFVSCFFEVRHIPQIYRVFRFLGWVSALLACLMAGLWLSGIQTVSLKTPLYGLGRFLGDSTLVESSLLFRPLLWDWFASLHTPRFNVFSPYPTAAGGIIAIILAVLLSEASARKRFRSPEFWFLFASNCAGLVMTLSRISLFAFVVAVMVIYLLQKKNSSLWLMFFLGVFFLSLPLLHEALEFLLSLREGSNVVRLQLYQISLQRLEGADWLFGLGIKPRETYFHYPLGSHSTYLSLLFKSGVGGAVLFLIFQIYLGVRWYAMKFLVLRNREVFIFWRCVGMIFVAMAVWTLTEDIDAPQFLAFLYFSFIGFFEGLRQQCARRDL